jgi:copper chaperone CopZ
MKQPVIPNRSQPALILLHRLPARLRLGVPALRDGAEVPPLQKADTDSSLADVVETAVGAVDGVTHASANPVTGSLLVEHDGAPGREAAIVTALHDVLPPNSRTAPDEPHLLSGMRQVGQALNQATLGASKGRIDLSTALPLLLGIYGLSRLLSERPFRPPSGLTLVWWAYTSMRQLTHESKR